MKPSTVLTLVAVVSLGSALVAAPAIAQGTPFTLKVDVYTGFGGSFGGGARDVPAAVTYGVLAATPVRVRMNDTFVIGLSANSHIPLDYGTECTVVIGTIGCRPHYPTFNSIAALIGWERVHKVRDGGMRLLVGPARLWTREKNSIGDGTHTLMGLQGRLDVTNMITRNFGVSLWTQGATASPFKSDPYFLLSGGVGFRLQ